MHASKYIACVQSPSNCMGCLCMFLYMGSLGTRLALSYTYVLWQILLLVRSMQLCWYRGYGEPTY